MAFIPLAAPYSLKTATLTVDADSFEAAVSDVTFTPTVATATWTGIAGNTVTDVSAATWAVAVGYAQDLEPGGLARYLHEHEGETADVVFTPVTADGEPGEAVAVQATVKLAPGAIGGKAGAEIAVATATWGVVGRPVFVDPVAPDPEAAAVDSEADALV